MKRVLLVSAAVIAAGGIAASPAIAGIAGNSSSDTPVPARVSTQVITPRPVDDLGRHQRDVRSATARHAEPGDDHGRGAELEPGDSHGRGAELEPGDDHGRGAELEPGDDHGRGAELEPGDERGRGGEFEPGDDHGRGAELEPGDGSRSGRGADW